MPTFNDAQIGVFHDFDRCNAYCKRKGLKPIGDYFTKESCGGAAYAKEVDGVMYTLVYVPRNANKYTLSHESLHLAFGILHTHGVKVKNSNHESLAYLQEFLFRQLTLICRNR